MPALSFTEDDWGRVERDTMAWWAGELDRPLVYLAATDPATRAGLYGYQSNYPLSLSADAVVDCYAPALAAARFYGDAFPYLWINFGPGIGSASSAPESTASSSPSETVWFTPPGDVPVQLDVSRAYDPDNPWWRRVRAVTQAFVAVMRACCRWDIPIWAAIWTSSPPSAPPRACLSMRRAAEAVGRALQASHR